MKTLTGWLALILSANGLWMLVAPAHWYGLIPGVSHTGAFNPHFVRDIGAAYLVAGFGFAAWHRLGAVAKPAAWAGTGFLLLHGAIHIAEALGGVHGLGHLLRDGPAVLGLPLLALWSLWPRRRTG